MGSDITPQKIYQVLEQLPEDCLNEVWRFIEFIQYKNKNVQSGRVVKLGGLLADYKFDITEEDILKARQEMWHNLGEINE